MIFECMVLSNFRKLLKSSLSIIHSNGVPKPRLRQVSSSIVNPHKTPHASTSKCPGLFFNLI